jgi:hypothetical protein
MSFDVPRVWREPNNSSDSYLCVNYLTGVNSKSIHTEKCPDLPSAMRLVPQSEEMPVTKPQENLLEIRDLIMLKITDIRRGQC